MRKFHLIILAAACLSIAGCSSFEKSFNVLTFQKDDKSGITKGQQFLVYPLGGPGFYRRADLAPLVRDFEDSEFQDALSACTPPSARKLLSFGLPTIITNAGQLLYNKIFSEIEAKADRLAKQSLHESTAVVTWAPSNSGGGWRSLRCVLIARLTDLDDDKTPNEIGMLTIIARRDAGPDASILQPIYFRLNNAVAITGASERPTITIGIGMTIEAVEKGKIVKTGAVKLANDISAIIGAETPVCVSAISENHPAQACPVATNLFVDPSASASAFQLSVAVNEVGSAAKINEGVSASTAALKKLTDPVFNEFLKQLAAAAKGN